MPLIISHAELRDEALLLDFVHIYSLSTYQVSGVPRRKLHTCVALDTLKSPRGSTPRAEGLGCSGPALAMAASVPVAQIPRLVAECGALDGAGSPFHLRGLPPPGEPFSSPTPRL